MEEGEEEKGLFEQSGSRVCPVNVIPMSRLCMSLLPKLRRSLRKVDRKTIPNEYSVPKELSKIDRERKGNIGSKPVPRVTASTPPSPSLLCSPFSVIDGSKQFLIPHSAGHFRCFGVSGKSQLAQKGENTHLVLFSELEELESCDFEMKLQQFRQ